MRRDEVRTFSRRGARFITLGAVAFTAFLSAGLTAEASTILSVAGSTTGCFGTSCSTFSTSATSPTNYDLIFTGTPFAVTTDAGGGAADILLGTLARDNTRTPATTPPLPFTLQVTFTLPTGIAGGQADTFSALITGISANGGGGPLPVDFDNSWIYFSFVNALGSGSFEFAVTNDPRVNKNNDDEILGSIRNALFTPATPIGPGPNLPPAGGVPEPTVLVLLGTAALTYARQRRIRSR